ncbi:MAG: hypothetical protein SFW08_01645, partial [Gemmatimonadaceae bacterium]|nr:hypothetical protein [Gemmatimonadaceae bacterium]
MVSAIDVSDRYLSNNGELAYHLAFDGGTSGLFIAGAVQGVDFFLRGTGAGVVDWLDADWKDSLDLDTDAPGALGTELVTIEDTNVRIVADAGTSTISVGRLNASGSLLLGEVIGGGPSLVINGSDAGDSSIESLHIDGGRLEIRDNLLIGGASEWTDAFVTIADDVSLTNSATLLIKDAVLDGEGLLINAGPGTLTLGSAASVAMSALKLINLGTLKAQAGSLEAIGFTTETVRNEGTFIKDADGSATLDVFTVSTAWENSGEVRIRGGEMAVLNNGTVPSTRHLDGAHYRLEDTLASRSILRFGGAHEMSGAVTIDGAGLWLLDDATLDLAQAALGANVDMQWRAADVKTDGSVTDGVASGGLVLRAGRKLDIEAAATGERASRLTGVLDARGTVRQHEADLVLKQASIVLTHGGADSAWFLDGKADVLVDGAGSRFLNLNGVLQRQRGGESRFEAFYEGSSGSSVVVDGGSLVFAGGGEFNAASLFITGGGGERGRVRLERSVDGTPYTVTGTLSIGGSDGGDFIIEDGAVLRTEEAGSVVFDAPDVTLDGGVLSGPGHFVNQATMHWKKGQLGLAAFGPNSATLENHHVLVIGDDAGERILAGSLLTRGELVQQRGVLSLSGGLVQLETVGSEPNAASGGWQSSADIVVDANGGRVDVQKGARFAVVAQRQVTVAADFFNQGRVSLGTGSELQLTGEVGQNALGVLTGGGWTLDAHARLALSGGQIETIGAGAEVDLGEGSVFDGLALSRNDGGLRLSAKATLDVAADLTNAGQFVAVDDAQLTVADLFDNPGQFTGLNAAVSASQLVNRGSLTLVGGSLVTTGVLRNEGEMRLDRVGVNAGVIFANEVGASLTLDAAVINAELFALNGAIHGTGILNGAVRQFGTLAPGASPGTLIVNG